MLCKTSTNHSSTRPRTIRKLLIPVIELWPSDLNAPLRIVEPLPANVISVISRLFRQKSIF